MAARPFKAARDVTGAAYRGRVQGNGVRAQKKGVVAEVRNEPLVHGRGLCAGLEEKPCRGVRQISFRRDALRIPGGNVR